jgi:hypothetical protein
MLRVTVLHGKQEIPVARARVSRTTEKVERGACGEWAHSNPPASAQAVARGVARYVSQVLDRGAQAVFHGSARCAAQVLDRGA